MTTSVPNTLTISLVFNVLLGLTFGGLYIFLYPGIDFHKENPRNERVYSGDSFKQNGFCFSCDDLGSGALLKETLYTDIVTMDCGHRLCCTTDDVLRDFLLAVSDRLQNEIIIRVNLFHLFVCDWHHVFNDFRSVLKARQQMVWFYWSFLLSSLMNKYINDIFLNSEINENSISALNKSFQFWRGRDPAAHVYIDSHNPISKGEYISTCKFIDIF